MQLAKWAALAAILSITLINCKYFVLKLKIRLGSSAEARTVLKF